MHNKAPGHEDNVKPVGPNKTEQLHWQHFCQQCLLIVDMTFAENTVTTNNQAVACLAQAIQKLAMQKPSPPDALHAGT